MTLESAERHYSRQAQVAYVTARQVNLYWRRVRPADVNAWRDLLVPAARALAAGQLVAAQAADEYVTTALREQGVSVRPEARVNPTGFAGMANGPVPVADLLDLPRIQALEAIGQGAVPAAALAVAGQRLQTYALSLVQDAGRQAVSAGITARPKVGWRRMVNPPCCSRCAILAGKWFKWNTGFQRHPHCDCTHIPAAEDSPGNIGTDPDVLFASGKVRGLTKSEAQAIKDGADPIQVVNASRGMSWAGETRTTTRLVEVTKKDGRRVLEERTVNVSTRRRVGDFTTEGTTRRGVASRAIQSTNREAPETARNLGRRGAVKNYIERRVVRPTPDAIYKYATSREDALQLLADNGYIRR